MWNEIIAWANEQWTAIASTGALGLIGIKTFILDKINLKRNANDYGILQKQVVATEQTTSAQIEVIYEKFELVSKKLDEQIAKMESVIEMNKQVIDATVSALSVANVPLQAKEKFHASLTQIDGSSKKIIESLKETINVQKYAQEIQAKATQLINDKIKTL
jgi:lipopolysaccharide biosynthesis regulator YciM